MSEYMDGGVQSRYETMDGKPSGASARAYPSYADAVQTLTELRAVPQTDRADKQCRYVEDERAAYHFDEQSTAVDDGSFALAPNDITPPAPGRWIKFADEVSIEPVTTIDATTTTLITFPISDDAVTGLEARIVGIRTNGADRADYIRRATIYRTGGGGATIQGIMETTYSRNSAGAGVWTGTIAVSGNNALVQVSGKSDHTVKWKAFVKVLEVS
jgi:hypothetical protein